MSTWKLFYDGGCNLCHTSKLQAEKWAKRAGQPLKVDVLLSDEAIERGYGDAMVLEADGHVYTAADAWLKLMSIAPWYLRWVALLSKTKPTQAVARFFYGIVAKYRLKWFGTRACAIGPRGRGTGSSPAPSSQAHTP
jgi:predicted DCC family thiol-disulfide oxidoreductase YuxK